MELGREDIKQINDLMPHVSIAQREAIKCANLGHELFTATVLGAAKWQLFYRLIDQTVNAKNVMQMTQPFILTTTSVAVSQHSCV